MTSADMLVALGRIQETHDVQGLARLALAIRAANPNDAEAEKIARAALLKRQRLVREG